MDTLGGTLSNCISDRDRLSSLIEKTITASEINTDGFFFSKAGNYLNEGIDQILRYEKKTIEKYGFCLWVVGESSVHADTVRQCCIKRAENNMDTYVFFLLLHQAYMQTVRQTDRVIRMSDINRQVYIHDYKFVTKQAGIIGRNSKFETRVALE